MSVKAFVTAYTTISDVLMNTATVRYDYQKSGGNAIWDTGASRTCISYEVVKSLNLTPIGKQDILTPSGLFTSNTYLVDIILLNNVTVPNVLVQDAEIGAQGISILIGMDIIGLGDFSVSNYNGKTVFTFRTPSQERIDYTK